MGHTQEDTNVCVCGGGGADFTEKDSSKKEEDKTGNGY